MIKAVAKGFDHVTSSVKELSDLPSDMIPAVGCQPELVEMQEEWRRTGRRFIYWDRGYLNRGGITWLKRGAGPEYFRWHVNRYQMARIDENASAERCDRLKIRLRPWNCRGRRIMIAAPSPHYAKFHRLDGWIEKVRDRLKRFGRPIDIRLKSSRVSLERELLNVHCLVTHGSVAAIEALVFGCPVIVDPMSAAAPVGRTSCDDVENLVFPDRKPWLRSLAGCQFTLGEIANGTMLQHLSREAEA